MSATTPQAAFSREPTSADSKSSATLSASDSTITFGVFGPLPFAEDGSFKPEQLRDAGIKVSENGALGIEAVPTSKPSQKIYALQARTPGDAYTEVTRWNDVRGSDILLRKGYYNPSSGAGFGLTKASLKHNLSSRPIRSATAYVPSNQIIFKGGSKYEYRQDVYEVRCGRFVCENANATTVITSIDYRLIGKEKEPFGVVISYCSTGNQWCPDWVKDAVNAT